MSRPRWVNGSELLKTLNELYSARASRLSAVEGHIPDVVWWIMLLGATTVGFTYLFGFHDFRMHMVMTMIVAASLALVVVMIVAMDWPFRGQGQHFSGCACQNQKSWGDLRFNTQLGRTRGCSSGSEKVAWNRSDN